MNKKEAVDIIKKQIRRVFIWVITKYYLKDLRRSMKKEQI